MCILNAWYDIISYVTMFIFILIYLQNIIFHTPYFNNFHIIVSHGL